MTDNTRLLIVLIIIGALVLEVYPAHADGIIGDAECLPGGGIQCNIVYLPVVSNSCPVIFGFYTCLSSPPNQP